MQVRYPFRPGAPAALVLAAALVACDGGTDAPVPASLTVTPSEAIIEEIGGTRQFTARVLDAAGSVIPEADVSWTSSATGVATIDPSGVATAVGTGTTTITATAGAASSTATLRVALAAFTCLPGDGTPVSLAVGEVMIVTDPSSFCLTLPSTSGQQYLYGVQSIEQSGSVETPVLVQSSTAPMTAPPAGSAAAATAPAGPAAAATSSSPGSASLRGPDGPLARLRRSWRAEHTRRMERDVAYLEGLAGAGVLSRASAAGPEPVIVGPGMELGDTVTVRVRKADAQCGLGDFEEVTVELVWKGDRAWWFDDLDNPDAFTLADWQALGDRFDDVTDPVASEYFGPPFDFDGNGVIVVVFTKALNERGSDEGVTTQGFVNPCDLLPRQTFQASNEGEFFYHIAADPAGQFGDTIAAEELIPAASSIIAHEYAHIIQFSRRIEQDLPLMRIFLAEGQATLSEEVVGHRVLGNRPGQNYGVRTAFADEGRDWYANGFIDLFFYYGLDLENETRVEDAPERCTWTAVEPPDPCKGRALWYGVTWSLLRWASDQFAGRSGGEAAMHRRLVDNPRTGLDAVAHVTGESVSNLLGHWAPMLYMDDRIPTLDPRLRMTSWNLFDIYTGLNEDLLDILQPRPRRRDTTNWEDRLTVRSPSFEWYNIATTGQAVGLRATTQDREVLPSHMQLFMVRIR